MKNPLHTLSTFLGVPSLNRTGKDAYILIILRSSRLFAAGVPALALALFFSALEFPSERIGLFMTLTLFGDVLLSLALTLIADAMGRRLILFAGSALMAVSGAVFALSENFWVLLVAAVFGVISVTGSDCGPFRAIEESMLSGLTTEDTRGDVLSWYVMVSTLAGAVGTEVAGRVVSFVESTGKNEKHAYHMLFWGYAFIGVLGCVLCLGLSRNCEIVGESNNQEMKQVEEEGFLEAASSRNNDNFAEQSSPRHTQPSLSKKKGLFAQISGPTRSIMYKLWILLAIDSLADGMTPYSLMNYYVDLKFHPSKALLGDLTSASLFLCAFASIFAGPISRRIGLINTMVFTHLPSSISSAFIPVPKTLGPTIGIMLFRACLNSMDQAPRTAFIAGVVKPEERTGVMGITTMARTLASSIGPTVTGLLAGSDNFWVAFLVAGICRVGYDLGLWVLFVNVKLRDESDDKGRYESVQMQGVEDFEGLLGDTDSESELSSLRTSKDDDENAGKKI